MSITVNVGDTVVCTHSASPWYTVGKYYEVFDHPDGKGKAVRASDGLFDRLSLVISNFERVVKP